MKKITVLLMAICLATSCSEFDDSDIWDKLNDHEYRIAYLEEVCNKMNADIVNLQTIVTALETNDNIVNASPLQDGSGYVLIFKSGKSIIINHGKDGVDGTNGKDGADGKDGVTPNISVMKDVDGIYYWTINGEWLLINGEKVRASAIDGADGKDGITPQFKIENNYWYISYDNGASWDMLGKATGSNGLDGIDGTDGDSMFKRVYVENGYVCFELNDDANTIIRIPLMKDGILNVTVETAGTLSKILTSEQTRTTTMLTIKGRINIDDMRHIQIMNSLHTLDLSEAVFCDNLLALNPYNKVVVNKTLEEIILPKESINESLSVDLSYCLFLNKVKISRNKVSYGFHDESLARVTYMKFCPNVKVLEYAEGVTSCDNPSNWETVNTLETIIYPSTLEFIPIEITISNSVDIETSNYNYKRYLYTIPCEKLICKAMTPPVIDKTQYANPEELFYDSDNKHYYFKSTYLGTTSRRTYEIEVPDDAVLYVPRESIELYKSAPLWENFTDIRAIEDME